MRRLLLALLLILAAAAPAAFALTLQDQRIAYRAQARLTDLPGWWRTAKSDTSKSGTKCLDLDRVAKPTGKSSRTFAKGEVAQLISIVVLYRSAAETQRVFALVARDRTWDCLAAELQKVVHATGVTQGRYLLRGVGAQNVAREILISAKASGQSFTVYAHAVLARKGRALVYFVPFDAFSPTLSLGEESALLRRMTARLP
jgi:hypothetical protein